MAKPKSDAPRAGHNSMTIPWPQDPQGTLQGLKRGGVEAVRRINGDQQRLDNFKQSLRLLAQHADARFKIDTDAREQARENAIAAARRVESKAARILQRDYESAQAHADHLKNLVKHFEGEEPSDDVVVDDTSDTDDTETE